MEKAVVYIRNETIKALARIAEKNSVHYDSAVVARVLAEQAPERMVAIIKAVAQAGKEADLFGGLGKSRVDPLTSQAAGVTLDHECIKWAGEILEQATEGRYVHG